MQRPVFRKKLKTPIDDQIDAVLIEMRAMGVDSPEYLKLMAYLERLHTIKTQERPNPVSRDSLALIVGNLLGILVIVAYEQKHVMTSKGFTQILRPTPPKQFPQP